MDAQFTISTGDNIYVGNTEQGMRESFENLWAKSGVHSGGPWFLCRGNHDSHGPQLAYSKKNTKWVWPETYFTKVFETDLNFTVQVWSIDSHGFDNNQLSWLTKTVEASKARWKIFFTHYPWISSGRHKRVPAPVSIAQVAKKYGVQVVFNGHDHLVQSLVSEGVAFVGTGAVARGAMLNRGIDQDKTDFLWAFGIGYHVGYHGIVHIALTRNVMWGMLFFHENLVHEFTTVHDYPFQWKNIAEEPKDKSFPPPKEVLKYLTEEADSTKEKSVEEDSAPTPTNAVETKLAGKEDVLKVNNQRLQVTAPAPPPAKTGPVYVVSTTCLLCEGPSVNRNLTLWVQGVRFAQTHRVFLSYSSADCTPAGQEQPVMGTSVIVPTGPVMSFRPRGSLQSKSPVFVCYSDDEGKSFSTLMRAGLGRNYFDLHTEPDEQDPVFDPSTATKAKSERKTRKRTFRLPSNFKIQRADGGVSTMWFFILLASAVVGMFLAWKKGRQSAGVPRVQLG
eukprot:TRINITY_DN1853_c0_g4_i4.p1 TRINITY_DN1853_c0_g4~~TRINITY_DN1853_c0_g4_i4.p1  ORF type:complete len:574 (+),score=184.41 TRINITY_DN1853_c0_g4_i4:212-1723(+)